MLHIIKQKLYEIRHSYTSERAPKLSVIIPVYNALEDIQKLFNSIDEALLTTDVEFIIVNDASGKETTDFLIEYAKDKEKFFLYHNENNLGFIKTCNKDIDLASGDIIVLLNSDTMIPPHWDTRIIECFKRNKKIGIASPLSTHSTHWNIPCKDKKEFINMDKIVENTSDKSYPTLICPEGFCFCIRKKVITQLGKLDEIFGLGYCEETDFALRALNKGWKTVLIDNLLVHHKSHASFGSNKKQQLLEHNQQILCERWKNLYIKNIRKYPVSSLSEKIYKKIYAQ